MDAATSKRLNDHIFASLAKATPRSREACFDEKAQYAVLEEHEIKLIIEQFTTGLLVDKTTFIPLPKIDG